MQLVIGNKNYSSWSMRPWVLMAGLGIAFDEVLVPFDDLQPGGAFKRRIVGITPAGRVPVLVDDDGLVVWDTLAIAEYLAERFPQAGVWPTDRRARARARSLCAEMHAGFGALRNHCPMNIEASLLEVGQRVLAEHPAVPADLQRIVQMWTEAMQHSGGPFLFGAFSNVDAYYAPVAMRIRTYGLPVPAEVQAYLGRLCAQPAVARWISEALAERQFVPVDEPYRQNRV